LLDVLREENPLGIPKSLEDPLDEAVSGVHSFSDEK
jgi:hypothetical protein